MSLSNIGIGRKLAIGFACILVAVAVMNATLFGLLRAADHAAGENAAFYKTIGDLDRSARAAAEESRASRGYIIARQDGFQRGGDGRREHDGLGAKGRTAKPSYSRAHR